MEASHPAVLSSIADKKLLDDEVKAALEAALKAFGERFVGAAKAGAAA
jgi:hypothetical protein